MAAASETTETPVFRIKATNGPVLYQHSGRSDPSQVRLYTGLAATQSSAQQQHNGTAIPTEDLKV
jgi:hypothetical protein